MNEKIINAIIQYANNPTVIKMFAKTFAKSSHEKIEKIPIHHGGYMPHGNRIYGYLLARVIFSDVYEDLTMSGDEPYTESKGEIILCYAVKQKKYAVVKCIDHKGYRHASYHECSVSYFDTYEQAVNIFDKYVKKPEKNII